MDGSATNDVWAVGATGTATLIQRWNGTAWSGVLSPSPAGASSASLRGIKTFGASGAWAVGNAVVPTASPSSRTLIQLWDGTRWSIVDSPSPDPTQNLLVAVDGVAEDDV